MPIGKVRLSLQMEVLPVQQSSIQEALSINQPLKLIKLELNRQLKMLPRRDLS